MSGPSDRENKDDASTEELEPCKVLVEEEDIKEVSVAYLNVHEHAHGRRIDTLIHARSGQLGAKVAQTSAEELDPGHCTTMKLEYLMI